MFAVCVFACLVICCCILLVDCRGFVLDVLLLCFDLNVFVTFWGGCLFCCCLCFVSVRVVSVLLLFVSGCCR